MHKTLGSLVALFNPVFGNEGEMELTTKHSTIPWQYICLHSSCCTICDLCENVEYLFALSFSFNLKTSWIDSSPQIKVVFIYSPQIAISDICKLINLKNKTKTTKNSFVHGFGMAASPMNLPRSARADITIFIE